MTEAELWTWLTGLVAAGPARRAPSRRAAGRLMAELGMPQDEPFGVHVVGTAGKGTTAGLLTARLADAGVPVVTHMSPHVHDLRERFLLDGELPAWPDVLSAADDVVAAANRLGPGAGPSYFAATAAIAWVLGREHGVEVAVVEAGIGGRDDATNVMTRPDVITVITAIGLDHTDVLGPTVEAIAAEKAAVLHGRRDGVLAAQPEKAAAEVVRRVADGAGCRLHEVEPTPDWRTAAEATVEAVVPLLESRLGRGLPPTDHRLPPGRLEEIEVQDRRLVIDGAHNPMKLTALADSLQDRPRPAVVIAAVGQGKDLAECARLLAALGELVVATEFGGSDRSGPRSHPGERLAAEVVSSGGRAVAAPRLSDAVRLARAETTAEDTILVTGSFLHLAEVVDAIRRG